MPDAERPQRHISIETAASASASSSSSSSLLPSCTGFGHEEARDVGPDFDQKTNDGLSNGTRSRSLFLNFGSQKKSVS